MGKKSFFCFVTGGNISSIGKGVAAASIGVLFKNMGYKIAMLKCDPYLNADPGTQNPNMLHGHGEVFVTSDGVETDLDLGHYERFTDEPTCRQSNMTSGIIYQTVLNNEREGKYLGETVQIIPHISDEIIRRIIDISVLKRSDLTIVELGGTTSDIEGLPFIEAIRQMQRKVGKKNCCFVHLTYVPHIHSSGEIKTKLTQHSVRDLRSLGIQPDILICRTEKKCLTNELKGKISLFCDVDEADIIEGYDVENIYEIPIIFAQQKIHERICKHLSLECKPLNLSVWEEYCRPIGPSLSLKIGMVCKYSNKDAYKSIDEALKHACRKVGVHLNLIKIDSEKENLEEELKILDGILVCGGFGARGFEGKVLASSFARKNNISFLGICFGMQAACVAAARDLLGLPDANSTEIDLQTTEPIIDIMHSQKNVVLGGSMRLGAMDCLIRQGTKAFDCYAPLNYQDDIVVQERHRHRYEYNDCQYGDQLKEKGFIVSGINPETRLAEIIEYCQNNFYVGIQGHPEFLSRPFKPHPLFVGFIKAAVKRKFDELLKNNFIKKE